MNITRERKEIISSFERKSSLESLARNIPGADSICPERARSAGSRTALAPLQFQKMGCQNERKKLAQIRYQVTCYGIKLESGDLPRFFMIDEIDHARVSKKNVVRLSVSESSCGRSGFSEVVFLRSFLALSCEWECWNDMKVVTFRLAWGHGPWAPELHMATALDESTHFLAAFLFVATTKAWEKLNKCAKPKWKQTTTQASKRDEVALRLTNNNDEIWAWTPCGDCAGQVSALSLLSSSSAKRPWQSSREVEKIAPNQNGSKLRGRAKLDEESLAFDERSHLAYGLIADQISAPVLSAPTDLLREQIRWSTAPTVLGQTEPAEPPNRTPDPAAPSDLVLLLGTNRMRPGVAESLPRPQLLIHPWRIYPSYGHWDDHFDDGYIRHMALNGLRSCTHYMKRGRKSAFDRRRPSLFWKKIPPETSDGFETWQEYFWNIDASFKRKKEDGKAQTKNSLCKNFCYFLPQFLT